MFIPDKDCVHPDLIATTGDYLRIWQVKEDEVQLLKLLNNVSMLKLPVAGALFHNVFQTLVSNMQES